MVAECQRKLQLTAALGNKIWPQLQIWLLLLWASKHLLGGGNIYFAFLPSVTFTNPPPPISGEIWGGSVSWEFGGGRRRKNVPTTCGIRFWGGGGIRFEGGWHTLWGGVAYALGGGWHTLWGVGGGAIRMGMKAKVSYEGMHLLFWTVNYIKLAEPARF